MMSAAIVEVAGTRMTLRRDGSVRIEDYVVGDWDEAGRPIVELSAEIVTALRDRENWPPKDDGPYGDGKPF